MVKSKNKKRRAKASFRENDNADSMAIEGDGDGTVDIAGQEREREGEGEGGGARGDAEESARALSAGRLKKKQRWEQKLLKAKVDALHKQRQKLNKRIPEENATRKEVLQQLKTLVAAQTESHQDEWKKLERARKGPSNNGNIVPPAGSQHDPLRSC
ncbi:hypothetical protein CBR_g32 [Chara braunii]|uniref:Uncharacterized protein n=1 Tax=Chara braunii TaxID=69332 RepID=A0A388JLP1_CHABU|nr:hypothetical protein CBR_g32 [Chara braunii]|eukprot:GBG58632.1 hypothetical protein CBR_g32 [Chara braunii]